MKEIGRGLFKIVGRLSMGKAQGKNVYTSAYLIQIE